MDFRNIRLVGLDLDGTVFTNDKRITPRTKKAITDAIRAGVLVIPATGRPLSGMPKEFTEIPGVRYLLGCNGASVFDQKKGAYCLHEGMNPEAVKKAWDLFSGRKCAFEVYADGKPYISRSDYEKGERYFPDPHILAYVRRTRNLVESISEFLEDSGKQIEKINISFPSEADRNKSLPLLQDLPDATASFGLPNNLELSPAGTDKGTGLLKLGEYLGLTAQNIMACGDSGNDLAMIRAAGIGVAMANADPAIKAAADYILPYSNEEEGVAWLLEQVKNCRETS